VQASIVPAKIEKQNTPALDFVCINSHIPGQSDVDPKPPNSFNKAEARFAVVSVNPFTNRQRDIPIP
jgi:hypothetical protein